MLKTIFTAIYTMAIFGLSLYGLQSLILAMLYLIQRGRPGAAAPPDPEQWPRVTIQLPIFNEQFVVERLIDAAAAMDYPREALSIQVLDDSTDNTLTLSRQRVAYHRARGIQIELLHRVDRRGYKAGALAAGLEVAPGEFIAIFDADFVPPPDFIRRLVPYLVARPNLGMVQGRWGHLNDRYNLLTRGQVLYLDGHFVIEQVTRSRFGLLFNFNGSAGIWRRKCIEDAGGWQGDTLSEDLDLSYRAQMKGWKFAFVPDVIAPAEIPPQVTAFKQQQYRWARGSIQVLRKLAPRIWSEPRLNFWQRLSAFMHLSTYMAHPLMMVLLLACLPVVLTQGAGLPSLRWLSLAGFGPPLVFALSQWASYTNWKSRTAFFPVMLLLGVGIAFSNSRAVLAAFSNKPASFVRTPKSHVLNENRPREAQTYNLPVDWTIWMELALSAYALATTLLAVWKFPPLVPLLIMFTMGFGYVGILGLLEKRQPQYPGWKEDGVKDAPSA